jgi:hypothetical protein
VLWDLGQADLDEGLGSGRGSRIPRAQRTVLGSKGGAVL